MTSLSVNAIETDSDKMNACFITINSSEEKESFKHSLSTGKNKNKFNFHEFVPKITEHSDTWFDQACKKNVRCDILIISGHFAGSFFSKDSKATLSTDQLIKKSCDDKCRNILSSPKEVFLLGCNTLAGQEKDGRTPEEYLQVLLDDHFSLQYASMIVEQRYGKYGPTYKSTMKRTFNSVPNIYGFYSIGPSGKNIQPKLQKYLKDIPNYYEYLTQVEMKRSVNLLNKLNDLNNGPLEKHLKSTSFSQTTGILLPCSKKDDSVLEKIRYNICKLKNSDPLKLLEDKEERRETSEHIVDLLKAEEFSVYLPVITEHIGKSSELKLMLKSLLENEADINKKMKALIKSAKTKFGKLKVAKIAYNLGAISKEEIKKIEKNIIISYLGKSATESSSIGLCSYPWTGSVLLKASDIQKKIPKSPHALSTLACFKIHSSLAKKIEKDIFDIINKKSSETLRESALEVLFKFPSVNKKMLSLLSRKIKKAKFNKEKIKYFKLLLDNNHFDSNTYEAMNQIIKSPNFSKRIIYSLDKVPFKTFDRFKKTYNLWVKNRSDKDNDSYFFSKAISNLPEEEQLNFLKDNSIGANAPETNRFHKKLQDEFYSQYYLKDKNGKDKKMPFSFSPFYIKEMVRKKEKNPSLFLLEKLDIKSYQDEESFINQIENANFSTHTKVNIIKNLPKNSFQKKSLSWIASLYKNNADKSKLYEDALLNYLYKRQGTIIKSDLFPLEEIYEKTNNTWLKKLIKKAAK